MVERFDNLIDDLFDFPQISDPALIALRVARQRHRAFEAMAVNFFEQVMGVSMAKVMRGFELEIFFNLELHNLSHRAANLREHIKDISHNKCSARLLANRLTCHNEYE